MDLTVDVSPRHLLRPVWKVDILAGVGFPAAPEHFPFRFFAAREHRLVLDAERCGANSGHFAQHPFAEWLAANEDHLPAARIVSQRVEHTLQAGTVAADRLATEFLDIDPVGLGI